MHRFFRRLAIIAALALAVFGIMATALALGFPETPKYVWETVVWACGISIVILFAWFFWGIFIFTRAWWGALFHSWQFQWPISRKGELKRAAEPLKHRDPRIFHFDTRVNFDYLAEFLLV